MVVADLSWQIFEHATAMHLLLTEQLYTSALVVLRAIYEAQVTLRYLVQHQKSQDEAVIFLAFSYLRDIKHFGHQADLVDEYSAIVERMPKHLVEEAKRRAAKHPPTWSGKTVSRMADEAGMVGHVPTYGFLSAEAHSAALGRHVSSARTGDMMSIETGRQMSPEEVESTANFARRAVHFAFKTIWGIFDAPKISFDSTDPEEWRRKTPM
jgi:hypothetical protein